MLYEVITITMSWNYRNTIAVGVLILLILQGCEPDACFHAAGNADSKEVYGPDFWSLKVESMIVITSYSIHYTKLYEFGITK